MGRTIINRILMLPFVLFGLTIVLFLISQVIPSDPAQLIVGRFVPAALRKSIDNQLGLNRPLTVQYFSYLDRLVHGNLGTSIRYGEPVRQLLIQALPATAELVLAGTLLAVVVGIPLGFIAARYRDTWLDIGIRTVAMVGVSVPSFYLAIVSILIFAYELGWFPISGRGNPPDLNHIVLPAIVLAYGQMGQFVRVLRANLADTMSEDHIRAARGRGIGEARILVKLAGRNSVGPTVTVLGLGVANLAGQVILIETVFGWPGVGNLVQYGILWNDFPLVTGALILLLTYTIVVTLIVDVLYAVIDPRLRLGVQ